VSNNLEYREFKKQSVFSPLLLLVFHGLLAIITRSFPFVATVHAYLTILIGIILAIFGKSEKSVVYVVAYISGAEVFWRMNGANVFWETGKYATLLILGLSFLRIRIKRIKKFFLPLLYFLLLCISIPLTLEYLGIGEESRSAISFCLSGPLALAVCVIYFSQIELDLGSFEKIAWTISFPIMSIFTLSAYNTLTAQMIHFTNESNLLTSGGFGPNQVSAVLGLGSVMLLLVSFTDNHPIRRWLAIIVSIGFIVQSALTFSRGGLYNAGICIVLLAPHYLFVQRRRNGAILFLFIFVVLLTFFIYPKLELYTGGAISQRFLNLDTTGRLNIAQADIAIWRNNPLLGVGPGISAYLMPQYFGTYVAAHTEYSRLLAEHGVFGLISLFIMLIMGVKAYLSAPGWLSKAWAIVFLAWPLVEMSHAAMRIVSISFLFGLAFCVRIKPNKYPLLETTKPSMSGEE
jgi:hypothetical protein